MKGKSKGNSLDAFSIVHWSGSAQNVPTTSFQLMTSRNIIVEQALFFKVPVLQWNKHPTQLNLKNKKEKN